VILYFFERITEEEFVGPVIVAAADEDEAWRILSRREGQDVAMLRGLHWSIAQELTAFPVRPSVIYPSHYRRAILD
jgi:hypothetical protein